ncbi:RTA1 like protein-domain-containing protein [Mycena galopus ATCC 62051]|nr:RTA1 like protein-domain-containing protein [Mycena galopus ATCC 62051]
MMFFAALAIREDQIVTPDSHYGYVPQEAVAIVFLVLFAISTALHVAQATYFRMWWLLPTAALCGVGEVIGWSGRLWSSISPILKTPFVIQISTTIIAPTPLLAATFVIMARIIQQLGTSYSRLTPMRYTMVFLPCDIIALVVQGVGGGMASSAPDLAGANRGAHVMLGGIAFQFAVIIVFSAFAIDFTLRYLRDKPVRAEGNPRGPLTPHLKTMLAAIVFSTTVLFIRSVYRLIELSGGWNGRIIHTEVYFNVLDGGMVTLAIFTLNFVHPGIFLALPRSKPEGSEKSSEDGNV